MPKKQLLLPGAKSAILVTTPPAPLSPWWRKAVLILGLVAVLIGAADVVARFANNVFGADAGFAAFAPAILLVEPDLQGQVQGTSTAAFVPVRVVVPSIDVEAEVEQVGKTAGGDMATPKKLANVGWYSLGQRPGQEGNAVFAGHVNNSFGLPGVFKKLAQVNKGDIVVVEGEAGETLRYTVESIAVYDENTAPLEEIFKNTGPSQVVLITCEGTWDNILHTFDKRLVVVARLQNP